MDQDLIALSETLAANYADPGKWPRLLTLAGLDASQLPQRSTPRDFWFEAVVHAGRRNRVARLAGVALQDDPANELLKRVLRRYEEAAQPQLSPQGWQDVGSQNLEKIIYGQSALLPGGFLRLGARRAEAVAHLALADGTWGTGFLTRGDVLLTSHHVVPSVEALSGARVRFNYQVAVAGEDDIVAEYVPTSAGFRTSESDDWSAVQLQGEPSARWGFIEVGSAVVRRGDRVIIVQHPAGGPKAVGLYKNAVTYADDRHLQYLTDTLPGSSGSPVFNLRWELVGMHSRGGWMPEPGTNERLYRNAGIHVNVLRDGLRFDRA